jgi:Family of unknown function (DUF5681)
MTAPAMTDAQNTSHDTSAACEVGYGKPPRHTQFRKGQSGNPGGRPRRQPVQRANALLLAEAYRSVAIKEDGRMVPVTALQAVLRSQIELAINGDYRAQRDILKAVQHLELLKSLGEYHEIDVDDETDVGGETDQAGESDEEDESRDADETGESGEEDETRGGDETGGDETGSDGAGAAVTAAPDPAPPPENGAAPPISSAAPPAATRVPSVLRRSASPPSRRRTLAPTGSRGGRRRAVTTERATGGGPAAREGGRIPRENSRSAETFGKNPC